MKKILSLIMAVAISLSFVPLAKVSAATEIERLSGLTRFDTMSAISKAGWEKSDNVILVNGLNYADALTAVTVAKKYNAPILLTTGYFLEDFISTELARLSAKRVIIIGGTGVVPESVEALLRLRYLVLRVRGTDRYETSAKVCQLLGSDYDTAVVVNGLGYADALAVGPYAAIKGYPILYCDPKNGLSAEVKACIEGKKIIVAGGEGVVPSKHLPAGFKRVSGKDRYQTAYAILREFGDEFTGTDVVLATGTNFPDALAGGAFCAVKGAPLLLTDKKAMIDSTKQWVVARNPGKMYVLGGESTISPALITDIFA